MYLEECKNEFEILTGSHTTICSTLTCETVLHCSPVAILWNTLVIVHHTLLSVTSQKTEILILLRYPSEMELKILILPRIMFFQNHATEK